MSILGNRVLRREDVGFLTKGACYTDDLSDPDLEGALYVTYVRSTMAHAKIVVDVSDALTMPGVAGVFTAADLDGPKILKGTVPMFPEPMLDRPILAFDTVRFVGECIAVVLSENPETGEDAAEGVSVD